MSYQPDERDHFLQGITARISSLSFAGLHDDLPTLLAHERCKSVIVDTVRYAKQVRDPSTSPTLAAALCKKLSFKLTRTVDTWNNPQVSGQELWALLSGSESAEGTA